MLLLRHLLRAEQTSRLLVVATYRDTEVDRSHPIAEPLGDLRREGNVDRIAGATELSNTDIGQNLIDLITASTQYRGGTRVITAVQQLLDELMNLRR